MVALIGPQCCEEKEDSVCPFCIATGSHATLSRHQAYMCAVASLRDLDTLCHFLAHPKVAGADKARRHRLRQEMYRRVATLSGNCEPTDDMSAVKQILNNARARLATWCSSDPW